MTRRFKYITTITSSLFILAQVANAQLQDSLTLSESIAILARPSKDSITLRWAPRKLSTWQKGNKIGYTIERYVIVRDGSVLRIPEKTLLSLSPLKPLQENDWETLVTKNKYAAIAAQALFGEHFEVDLSKTDIFTILNKVRENEQRFAFALFCADMSIAVAKASGLAFTDSNVKKGEKYLYRVIINDPLDTQGLKGSMFISPDDPYELPKPQNVKAEFKDQLVSLKWDKSKARNYTAYIVERSFDKKTFAPISDAPLVTVSPTSTEETRYEYASDSLKELGKTYYYRVKGVSPFGEESTPSDVVTGKATITVSQVPYIKEGENIENKFIRLSWDFPEKNNQAIKGFSVERSPKPQGIYTSITLQKPLAPAVRIFEDKAPAQVNYYRVTALGLNGEQYRSPIYLAQLVDSIPPAAPIGLKAVVDDYGTINVSWQKNKENDIYGYRVYKGNTEKEELSQITSEPIAQASYVDKVNLNTLNESVLYKVMAIDKNQNHSPLSDLLRVTLPDKVKPLSPTFLPVTSSEKGVVLPWTKSSSTDVVRYELYRKAPDRSEWQRIKILPAASDSTYLYLDENVGAGKTYNYTVVAIDDAGLESDPSSAVTGGKTDNLLRSPIQWKDPIINREQNQVTLTWKYDQSTIRMFRVYKAEGENPFMVYKNISSDKRDFTDLLAIGKQYRYRIVVIFENGNKSTFSEELSIKF
jgi:fibronectin type 3 domain-containing protein